MIVHQILQLDRQEAEKLHRELYNTPEGQKALDIIKGNFNNLPEKVEEIESESEIESKSESKSKSKK